MWDNFRLAFTSIREFWLIFVLQNTLINTLIKNISNDPNHKGKKTIKITQHKYGTKKQKAPRASQPRPLHQLKGVEPLDRGIVQQQQTQQARTQYRTVPMQQQQQQQLQQQQQHQRQQVSYRTGTVQFCPLDGVGTVIFSLVLGIQDLQIWEFSV